MKKTDIVIAVVALRSKRPPTHQQIRKDIAVVLKHLAIKPDLWDLEVEEVIAEGLIKHVGSVKGELSLQDLILDIDMILKRIS
jgi:hypothetical protein